jgi:hypothetical protein
MKGNKMTKPVESSKIGAASGKSLAIFVKRGMYFNKV